MNFIDRVAELRKERGITEKQVMDDCHLGRNSFYFWKNGTQPSANTVQKLADYFGVSTDYLMGRDASSFLERVTELRKERNLTESQVLQDCGLNKNLFSNWKKGVVPAYATVAMLAAYFCVNVDYLLGASDEKSPTANIEGMGDLIKAYGILNPENQQKVKDLILECVKDQLPK